MPRLFVRALVRISDAKTTVVCHNSYIVTPGYPSGLSTKATIIFPLPGSGTRPGGEESFAPFFKVIIWKSGVGRRRREVFETLRKAAPVTSLFLSYMEPFSLVSRAKTRKTDTGKREYQYR